MSVREAFDIPVLDLVSMPEEVLCHRLELVLPFFGAESTLKHEQFGHVAWSIEIGLVRAVERTADFVDVFVGA
jgi:hypothetical protein